MSAKLKNSFKIKRFSKRSSGVSTSNEEEAQGKSVCVCVRVTGCHP